MRRELSNGIIYRLPVSIPSLMAFLMPDNITYKYMAEYYSQWPGAGMIITEGTAPAAEALSYPRFPVFSFGQKYKAENR